MVGFCYCWFSLFSFFPPVKSVMSHICVPSHLQNCVLLLLIFSFFSLFPVKSVRSHTCVPSHLFCQKLKCNTLLEWLCSAIADFQFFCSCFLCFLFPPVKSVFSSSQICAVPHLCSFLPSKVCEWSCSAIADFLFFFSFFHL